MKRFVCSVLSVALLLQMMSPMVMAQSAPWNPSPWSVVSQQPYSSTTIPQYVVNQVIPDNQCINDPNNSLRRIANLAFYKGQSRYFYSTFRGNTTNSIRRIVHSNKNEDGSLSNGNGTYASATSSKIFVWNPYGSMGSGTQSSANGFISPFWYTSQARPAGVDIVMPWYSAQGSPVTFPLAAPSRIQQAGQIVHNIWRNQVKNAGADETNNYLLYSPSVAGGIPGTANVPLGPGVQFYGREDRSVPDGESIPNLLCNNIYIAQCGDGVKDNINGSVAGGTVDGRDGMNTDRGFISWTVPDSSLMNEQCDNGSQNNGVTAVNGVVCNSQCQIVTPATVDLGLSKTVTPTAIDGEGRPTLTYTLTINNTTANPAATFAVRDILPAGVTLNPASIQYRPLNGGSLITPTPLTQQVNLGGTTTIQYVSLSNGIMTWNGTNMPGNGASFQIVFNVTPNDGRTQSYLNTGDVSTPGDTNPNNNTGTAITIRTLSPNLTIDKSANKTILTSEADTSIRYTITGTNNGNQTLLNVKITDILPAGVQYSGGLSVSVAGANRPDITVAQIIGGPAGRFETTPVVTLAPGQQMVVSFDALVTNTSLTNYLNTGQIVGQATGYNGQLGAPLFREDTHLITRNPQPSLLIDKTVDKPVITTSDTGLIYTITGTNNGNQTLTNVVITDKLPAGVVYNPNIAPTVIVTNGSPTAVGRQQVSGNPLVDLQTTPGVSLNPGGTIVVRFAVTIAQQLSFYRNTGSIIGTTPGGQILTGQDPADTVLNGLPDLWIDKTGSTSQLQTTDTTMQYTLAFGNSGALAVTGVQIRDFLPPGMSIVGTPVVTFQGQLVPSSQYTVQYFATNATNGRAGIFVDFPSTFAIQPGQSGAVTFTVSIDPASTQLEFDNRSQIGAQVCPSDGVISNTRKQETTCTNNADNFVATRPGPDLRIQKIAYSDESLNQQFYGPVTMGQTFYYSLRYSNVGTVSVNNPTITDFLPAGLQYVSNSAAGVSTPVGLIGSSFTPVISQNGSRLDWTLNGTFAPGTQGVIRIQVQVTAVASTPAGYINTGMVTYPGRQGPGILADRNPSDNISTYTIPPQTPNNNAVLTKHIVDANGNIINADSSRRWAIGETILFRLSYTNNSTTTPITNVALRDIWPSGQIRFDDSNRTHPLWRAPCPDASLQPARIFPAGTIDGGYSCRWRDSVAPGETVNIVVTGTVIAN